VCSVVDDGGVPEGRDHDSTQHQPWTTSPGGWKSPEWQGPNISSAASGTTPLSLMERGHDLGDRIGTAYGTVRYGDFGVVAGGELALDVYTTVEGAPAA
jgi:hypothetical protein